MAGAMQVRTVTIEFLREGPSHNQLLSPLTHYLGICGDSAAGIVKVPYEHREFRRMTRVLRYEDGAASDRLTLLREIGADVAKVLAAVPGLTGALTGGGDSAGTLIRLRLVLSASELALLPFELAKVPVGAESASESWLALQSRIPVCITRRARDVRTDTVEWPSSPRILFVAGEPSAIPFDEHRQALVDAIAPFRRPAHATPVVSGDGRREQFGDLLTIVKDARLDDVVAEFAETPYTHVHVLVHGAEDPSRDDTSFGLALRDATGEPDIVSGERFASAIASLATGRPHRPSVVTLATCDSGNVGSVVIPGASLAHTIHEAGVPFVVASQFPLGIPGSTSMVRTLYHGLVWAEDPWVLLHRIRTDLHGRYGAEFHDWASVVVYEALPDAFESQLETMRYVQARTATSAALERLKADADAGGAGLDPARHRQLTADVKAACDRLPTDGPYELDSMGLRAAAAKRLAQVEHALAFAEDAKTPASRAHRRRGFELLHEALDGYRTAARRFLVSDGRTSQRVASLHSVLTQSIALAAALGESVPDGAWEAARFAATAYLDHPDLAERAWAHGSLAELWTLRTATPGVRDAERAEAARLAVDHARELVRLYPVGESFPVLSTRRQFARYAEWWGTAPFAKALTDLGGARRAPWDTKEGLMETTDKVLAALERRERRPKAASKKKRGARASAARGTAKRSKAPGKKAVTKKAVAPKRAAPKKAVAKKAPKAKAPAAKAVKPAPKRAPSPVAPPAGVSGGTQFTIEMLPAGHGDCLWIEYGDGKDVHRVLIDCGTEPTWKKLQARIAKVPEKERHFEQFVLTHIDADHIGGAIPFFGNDCCGLSFDDIWFNGWKHLPKVKLGAKQGEVFSTLLTDHNLPWNRWTSGDTVVLGTGDLPTTTLPGGMRLTLLSPTTATLTNLAKQWEKEIVKMGLHMGKPEDFRQFLAMTTTSSTDVPALADAKFSSDTAAPNGSSIALLAEYGGKSAILGADAHAPVMIESIRKLLAKRGGDRLQVTAFKASHHASRNNVSADLIRMLDCREYLVSTNGSHFNHPDREAVARMIHHGGPDARVHFNFKSKINEVWDRADLQEKYGYRAVFPAAGTEGLLVSL